MLETAGVGHRKVYWMPGMASAIRILSRAKLLARPELLLLSLAVSGLALRLQKAWEDIPTIVVQATSDDAFYYFQIARNIANGHNVTFDGETLTNGFHPLWLALLTPIYFFTDSTDLPVHIALTMSAVFATGTIICCYLIVRLVTGNPLAALVGAGVYALHPYLIVESVNGLETSLSVFMIAVTTWLFLRAIAGAERPSPAGYAVLGAAMGLMVLARTDAALIIPLMLLVILVRERGGRRWTCTVITGMVACLVVAPWVIWNLVTFGNVVQVSAVAVANIDRRNYLDAHGHSLATQIERGWAVTKDVFIGKIPNQYFVFGEAARKPLLIGAAAFGCLMVVAPFSPQRREVMRQLGLLLAPVGGVVLILLFHSAIRWHVREWYLAPAAFMSVILLGVGVDYLHRLLRGTRIAWRARDAVPPERPGARRLAWKLAPLPLYAAVIAVLALSYGPQRSNVWVFDLPHRLNMLEAATWLSGYTEDDARIGAYNAGILGYFSDRTVINLDGKVNKDAYHARQQRDLKGYVCSHDITYIADSEIATVWGDATCEGSPPASFALVRTVGRLLYYFGGGQEDILKLEPEEQEPPDGGPSPVADTGAR